jgi:hypothetical protein
VNWPAVTIRVFVDRCETILLRTWHISLFGKLAEAGTQDPEMLLGFLAVMPTVEWPRLRQQSDELHKVGQQSGKAHIIFECRCFHHRR